MLSYIIGGFAAGTISALAGAGLVTGLSNRKSGVAAANALHAIQNIERLEREAFANIDARAKEVAALATHVREFEARTTAFQNTATQAIGSMATRDEVNAALRGTVTREELELALQSAAQQILRVAQNSPSQNGRALSALQEQVAGMSQQLGLG
ncbi:MAG: hypothetical protein VKI63_06015 [Cyanobium sp.]|nr:hypothetical protein [Cyanobium sp.]